MPRIAHARIAWTFAVLLAGALTPAPARAYFMIPPDPYRAKDFAFIKHDGIFHLFYIRHDDNLPLDQTERDLGHAFSTNIYTWTQLPPVLAARDTSWDDAHIWAPHIVKEDGVFYLFYTGVTKASNGQQMQQRIGVATSTDLMTWNRMDAPLLDCASSPWALCDPLDPLRGIRDPFVMRDPNDPARWLMYTAGFRSDTTTSMIVGAASSNDLVSGWSNVGAIEVTSAGATFSDLAESPTLFEHNGLWHMFWTTNKPVPIVLATSPDPLGPRSSWTFVGTLEDVIGVPTPWIAPEYLRDGEIEYFAYVNGYRIDVLRILWQPDGSMYLFAPSTFHVVKLWWNPPSIRAGETVSLQIEATEWTNRRVWFEAVEMDGSVEEPVPLSLLGLPSPLTLTGQVTTVDIVAPWLPDTPADGFGAELVVRTDDGTAVSPVLAIQPPLIEPGPDPEIIDETPGGGGGAPIGFEADLRRLARIPFRGSGFLVELEGEQHARLDVFDLQGRRVRSLADHVLPAGATVLPWDERGDDGARLRPGVYFARLGVAGRVLTSRVIVLP